MISRINKSFDRGFSLIELLLVLVIIGILAIIIVPRFMSTILRYHSRTEARELMIHFKKAKLEAAKRNRDVCINFINVGATGGEYRIFVNVDRDLNSPHTYNQGAGDIMLVERQLHPNVQFISTTFDNSQAGYNPRGLPLQLANQNVVLGSIAGGSRLYTLAVSQAGNVEIQ